MKISKMIIAGVLGMGMACSAFAASELTIVNNTNYDSTSKINGGMCSNDIPEAMGGGVTKAHQTKKVPGTAIGFACFGHSSDCKADVFMTNDCSGSIVATVIFDTKKGIQSITPKSTEFTVSGSGFNVALSGGK